MKILCTGDWHITNHCPKRRTDDFYQTMKEKVKWILNFAKENNCEYILQPGDFFDSYKVNNSVIADTIKLLYNYRHELDIVTIYGQHDMKYHSSDRSNTPLNLLDATDIIIILDNNINGLIQGISFDGDLDEMVNEKPKILMMHKMVINDEKLWAAQTDFITPNNIFKNTTAKLIVCGDNHQGFIVKGKDKLLVNCGSLMRTKKNQKDHKPFVVLYNTVTKEYKQIFIPVKPFNEVMDLTEIEEEEKYDKNMEDFLEEVEKEEKAPTYDFIESMNQFLNKNKDKKLKDILTEIMEGIL